MTLPRWGYTPPTSTSPVDMELYLNEVWTYQENKSPLYAQGTAAARPAAGTAGLLYFATDTNKLSYDTGTTWQAVTADVDPVAGVGGLRTLGAGSQQAAAGNHTHVAAQVTDLGTAATKNVGSTAGTVADGQLLHNQAILALTGAI